MQANKHKVEAYITIRMRNQPFSIKTKAWFAESLKQRHQLVKPSWGPSS
jgi:hypothetical protein